MSEVELSYTCGRWQPPQSSLASQPPADVGQILHLARLPSTVSTPLCQLASYLVRLKLQHVVEWKMCHCVSGSPELLHLWPQKWEWKHVERVASGQPCWTICSLRRWRINDGINLTWLIFTPKTESVWWIDQLQFIETKNQSAYLHDFVKNKEN